MYLNKKYVITQIGYGAEAGFFQYGVVFELMKDDKPIYAVVSYRHIANNDALSTIFKESLPCPSYYQNNINTEIDPFTDNRYVYSSLIRLSDDEQVYAAVGKEILENSNNRYCLILHVGCSTVKKEDTNCILILSDGRKLVCKANKVETTYVDNSYKMYYSVQIDLDETQIQQLANAYVTNFRFNGIEIKGIRVSLGQRFMYTTQAMLDY